MNICPTLILFNNVEENTKFMTGLIPTICVLLKIFKKKVEIFSRNLLHFLNGLISSNK